jgi:hypothetical protein
MQPLPYRGSTSDFYRYTEDVVLKTAMKVWEGNPNRESLETENRKALDIERKILETLGRHPRIVPFVHPFPRLLIDK